MKITPKNQKALKFQTGGAVPALAEPAPQLTEQDPIMMLAQMSALAIQALDCLMAMQVCQAFLEIVQQMQGSAPEEPQGEPVFRKGGVLVRRIKK